MKNMVLRAISLSLILIVVAACGTVATPVWEAAQETPEQPEAVTENAGSEAVAVQPTTAPTTAPTNTIAPPTNTPEPSPTPTEEPTSAPAASDPIVRQVQFSNAAHGEELFNTEFDTAAGPWKCATCHSIEPDVILTGPSQYGLADRAGSRVEGMVAERYIYNSIIHPNEYIVEGFVEGVMPQDYATILTEQDILDIVAYLMTLTEE